MTNPEREAMDERIRDMKRRGIPSHVRVEILKRELAAEAAARAEPETSAPDPPIAEPAIAPGTKGPAGESRVETKTDEPGDKRKPRTVKTKEARSMTEAAKKTSEAARGTGSGSEPRSHSGLKIVPEDMDPDPKLNGRPPGRPAGTADVRPRLIDAAAAARLCGVSKSGWWAFHAAGRCPLPVRLGRATRWRQDELSDWIDAGCPARSKWAWKPGRRR